MGHRALSSSSSSPDIHMRIFQMKGRPVSTMRRIVLCIGFSISLCFVLFELFDHAIQERRLQVHNSLHRMKRKIARKAGLHHSNSRPTVNSQNFRTENYLGAATSSSSSTPPLSSSSSSSSSQLSAPPQPPPLIRKERDEGWHVWQPSDGVFRAGLQDKYKQCDWTTFKVPGGSRKIQMCVHAKDDISDMVKRDGKWFNCEQNAHVWRANYISNSENKTFIDVGANIGACVFEMLLTTDANILAFEPSPRNLFCLTSTLLRLHPDLRSRVTLFPIGLGDFKTKEKIYGAKGNFGNSVVGGFVLDQDRPSQTFSSPEVIYIDTLQNILSANYPIQLMKIDAQGYECNVLKGMGTELSKHVVTIVTEVAPRWLRHHRCSPAKFFQLAQEAGFQIKLRNGVVLREPIGPPEPNDYDVVLSSMR